MPNYARDKTKERTVVREGTRTCLRSVTPDLSFFTSIIGREEKECEDIV